MSESPQPNCGTAWETDRIEYGRGQWNFRCRGKIRRYRKESQGDEIDPKKFSDSGTMMADQDVKSRKSGDLVGIPVHGGDAALKLAPPTAAHPGHTYNLNPEVS